MQGFALVDLVCSNDFGYLSHFRTCKALLEDIISNLPSTNKENEPKSVGNVGRSLISDEDSAEPHENGSNDEDEMSSVQKEGFRSVIGCEQAKSSLLENVILPMTLATTTFSHVFQGMFITCEPFYTGRDK